MIQAAAVTSTLENFVRQTPDVEGALLVSSDGLPISSIIPTSLDEERTSAMSAAMLSMGDRIAQDLARGTVDRILVEGSKGYSILVGCTEEIVLLVLATQAAKKGILFLAIKGLTQQLFPLLK